jgi:hypothetical protein
MFLYNTIVMKMKLHIRSDNLVGIRTQSLLFLKRMFWPLSHNATEIKKKLSVIMALWTNTKAENLILIDFNMYMYS